MDKDRHGVESKFLGCKMTASVTPQTQHHEYSPSAAHRWGVCFGSIKMSRGIPREESEFAAKGIFLHSCVNPEVELKDKPLDFEERDLIARCREYLQQLCELYKAKIVHLEYPLELMQDDTVLTFGTADCLIEGEERAAVLDWKFGHKKTWEAADSYQGMLYAAACLQLFKSKFPVDLYVVQPRLKEWISQKTYDEPGAIVEWFKQMQDLCEQDALVLKPGKETCQYCPALHICPAVKLLQSVLPSPDSIEEDQTLTCTEVVRRYEAAQILGKLVNQEKLRAMRFALAGNLPGYHVKTSRGNRKITMVSEVFHKQNYVTWEELLQDYCVIKSVAEFEKMWVRCYANEHDITQKEVTTQGLFAKHFGDLIERNRDKGQIEKDQ